MVVPKMTYDLGVQIGNKVAKFLQTLASQSERAAVVLGVAHVDFAVEKLLKSIMQYHPDGKDNLFDQDRPLGTFSVKIALAFRLAVIDQGFEHALQMIRKIRNDFAHSMTEESLSESRHKNRIDELLKDIKNDVACKTLHVLIEKSISSKPLVDFCVALAIIITALEIAVTLNERVLVKYPASFDWSHWSKEDKK